MSSSTSVASTARSSAESSGESLGESPRTLWFFTGLGLLVAFGVPIIPLQTVSAAVYSVVRLPWLTIYGLEAVSTKILTATALIAIVLAGERRRLVSIGIKRPRLADVALGTGAFAVAEAATYLAESVLPRGFMSGAAGQLALFGRFPFWLLLVGAIVNGIFEEISARGFAVERLSEVTHSTFFGAAIALALNLTEHIPFWGWRQTIILAPGLATFLALYLWRRSVIPCAIGHIFADAFPGLAAIVAAMLPMSVTPYLSYDRQGSIYYTKGDFDRAVQLYTLAISHNPRDVYAFDWRALAWLNKNDYAKSIADLTQAIRIDPKDNDSYAHRAFVYSSRGDYTAAIADLDQAIRLQPDDGSSYEMRARVESRLLDRNGARRDYRDAARLDPSNAELYAHLANEDYYAGDFAAAASHYYSVVRLDPNDAGGWSDLTLALIAEKKYDKALAALAHAFKINPDSSEDYQLRAEVRIDQKRLDLALADLDHAIALKHDDSSLYVQRGEIYSNMHQSAKAVKDWSKALELKDNDAGTYNLLAWMLATSSDPEVRDGERAILLALRSCEVSKWRDGAAIDTLAAAYAEAGDFAHAVEFENKAIALFPPDSGAMRVAGFRLELYRNRRAYHQTGG